MDEISSGLHVGALADAGNEALIQSSDVDIIVSLTHGEPENGYPESVAVSQCPMMDGPRNDQETFREAVEQVLAGLRRGDTVLVHCSRGASRSPSVAATAVALHEEIGIEESFEQVGEQRAGVDAHPALVRQAVRVYLDYSQ